MANASIDIRKIALGCCALLCVLAGSVGAQIPAPELFSQSGSSSGTTANDASLYSGSLLFGVARMSSDDGRFVLQISKATNMVSAQSDSNANTDIFLLDRTTGTMKLVSHTLASATQTGNGGSFTPTISGDGAWVAFYSAATDLVSGVADTNAQNDVFLYETATANITLLSRSAISANSTANNYSMVAQISASGRYITWYSSATDLVSGQVDTNAAGDLFVHDRITSQTRLVSHISGSQTTTGNGFATRNAICDDGTYIVFLSGATDLISGGSDTNAASDLFLYEISTGTITLITHAAGAPLTSANGASLSASISKDGSYVLFHHWGTNLVTGQVDTNTDWDVFLYDRAANVSRMVSHLAGSSATASITTTPAPSTGPPPPPPPQPTLVGMLSDDGRYAAYVHKATDLITGQTGSGFQIFLYDRVTDSNVLVSHTAASPTAGAGALSTGISGDVPMISQDGRYVAYPSQSANVVSGSSDSNGGADIFLYDRTTGANRLVSHTPASSLSAGNGVSTKQNWSRNGALLFFMTAATDLGGTDANGQTDTYGVSLGALLGGASPGSCGAAGGVSITLSGKGFTGTTAVRFGGISATNVSVISDNALTCTAPAHAIGSVSIELDSPFLTVSFPNAFAYLVAPTLTSVSPASGPASGGTNVALTGTSFTGATSVTFGGTPASNVVVVSNTSITCTTPAHAAGAVSVIVTTPVGTNAANTLFSYVTPAPTLTVISPSTGSTLGGTSVTLTGTDFAGATSVTFGGTAASSVSVISATSITCVTPAHAAGAVSVIVTTPSGSNAANSLFTYVTPAPSLSLVSPSSGTTAGGTNVTLTGSNFTGATNVTFGGTAATNLSVVNSTTLTCTTPAHGAGAISVLVTTPGGTNASNTLFTYVLPAPTVTAVSPNNGPTTGGTSVTLTGTNFTGATAVSFGGSAATGISVVSATSITCTTPAHAAANVSVEVTTPGGTSPANTLFTFVAPTPAPTVTGVSPPTGLTNGGTSVTITGLNFSGATLVTFGGSAASGVSVISANTITCATPAHAAGVVSVEVTTPAGVSPPNALFTYAPPAPTVSSVSPATGVTTGGTSVSISGADFTGATAVGFDGFAATSVSVVSATLITCITPAHSAGAVSVIVTTPSGSNAANTAYTYVLPAPTLSSVTPSSGSTAGGTSVTLIGTDFTGATSVTFGGSAATSVTVLNATTLTCMTPAHGAGTVSVIISTPSGANAANALFSYQVPTTPQEIDVQRSMVSIADGTAENLQTATGTNLTLTYTILNIGGTTLNVSGVVQLTNQVNCVATVVQQPAASVAAGGSTTLTLSITPAAAGAFSVEVSFTNNDSDENPYNWNIIGQASPSPAGGNAAAGGSGGGCTAAEGGSLAALLALLLLLGTVKSLARRRRA